MIQRIIHQRYRIKIGFAFIAEKGTHLLPVCIYMSCFFVFFFFPNSSSFFVHRLPVGLPDVSAYPSLFAELLSDPTWTISDLRKLAGENLLRVMRQVEEVRKVHANLEGPGDGVYVMSVGD